MGEEWNSCAGYCEVYSTEDSETRIDQRYYPVGSFNERTGKWTPSAVEIKAVARDGYRFLHWMGQGKAYKSYNPENTFDLEGYRMDTVAINMSNEENTMPSDRSLTAVFERQSGDTFTIFNRDSGANPGSCYCIGPNPGPFSGHTWWRFDTPTKCKIPSELQDYVNIPTGFGPDGNCDYFSPDCMGGLYLPDGGFADDVQIYSISHENLIAALTRVKEIDKDNNDKYIMNERNCTSIATEIAQIAGVTIPDAIGIFFPDDEKPIKGPCPHVLIQKLNGIECDESIF